MKKSFKLVLLSTLTLMGAGYANAQSAMGQTGNIPQFLPSVGWTVQPTTLSEVRGLKGVDLPCVMSTNYNNGYSLRFSGTKDKILAMAIDFRQDVFVQGRKYPASISIDGKYNQQISGMAFSNNVLIFNMRNLDGFNAAISDAVKMVLDVEGNPMVFALGGINSAMHELQGCSTAGSSATPAIKQAALTPNTPPLSITWEKPVMPEVAQTAPQTTQAQIWQAKAGDDMKATLQGWAKNADVDLDWQASGPAKVVSDIYVQGTFEEAVQALMANNAAALGLDANLKSLNSDMGMAQVSMPVSEPQQLAPISQISDIKSTGTFDNAPWSAPAGQSLQQTLQRWSQQAGVELVWQSNQGFAVRSPVAMSGNYEDAITSLLNQYSDQKIRPYAQLNNDPDTAKRILFIQSSRVL